MEARFFSSKTEQKQPLYVQQCKAQEQQDLKCWSVMSAKHSWKYAWNSERLQDKELFWPVLRKVFFSPSTPSISGEVQGTQKAQILGAEPLSQAPVTVLITGTIPSIPTEESKGMEKEGPAAANV